MESVEHFIKSQSSTFKGKNVLVTGATGGVGSIATISALNLGANVIATTRNPKKISEKLALKIAQQMENHPYYVQQLSQVVWQQTTKTATEENFYEAIEDLLDQYTILYQKEVDMLTNFQLNLLKALCNNEKSLTSASVLKNYNLGTSANITRIKTALQNHEIIDVLGKTISFNDPLFELWLKKRYFKKSLGYD